MFRKYFFFLYANAQCHILRFLVKIQAYIVEYTLKFSFNLVQCERDENVTRLVTDFITNILKAVNSDCF